MLCKSGGIIHIEHVDAGVDAGVSIHSESDGCDTYVKMHVFEHIGCDTCVKMDIFEHVGPIPV